MTTSSDTTDAVRSFRIVKTIDVKAPMDVTFDAVLEEMGPGGTLPGGPDFPMVLEAWPGGRWFRDLGDNTGHLWGHVQVIKPPKLIEVAGPLFMSYAATSHVQYKLAENGDGTTLTLTHSAIGLIADDHAKGVHEGWQYCLDRIVDIAERKMRA